MPEAGYDTAAFSCNSWVSLERGFARGFAEYYEMWRKSQRSSFLVRPEKDTVRKTIEWLDKRKDVKNPFFIFMNLNGIHLPYKSKEPFLSRFLTKKYNDEEISSLVGDVDSVCFILNPLCFWCNIYLWDR